MKTDNLFQRLKNSLIVSCQSECGDPFDESPMYMSLFARAAELGGASAIRTQGIEKINAIKQRCPNLPLIGLLKSTFPDGTVRITGSFSEVEQLIAAKCDIIAIDGTFRIRDGLDGPSFIREVKKRYNCIVLADVATLDEAISCEKAGADCVSSTLNGYTPDTFTNTNEPNFNFLSELVANLHSPVFAEGRYNTPSDAREAIKRGAFGVIVGSAITRPRIITSWYVEAINK